MMYVGFSRPTHLLSFAVLKENVINEIEKYRESGWIIIDLDNESVWRKWVASSSHNKEFGNSISPLSLELSEAFLTIFNKKETLSQLLCVYNMSSF